MHLFNCHVLVSQVVGPVIIEARTPNDLIKDVKIEYQEFSQQGVIRVTWSHKPGSNSTLHSQRLTICKSVKLKCHRKYRW